MYCERLHGAQEASAWAALKGLKAQPASAVGWSDGCCVKVEDCAGAILPANYGA
jgi:hypothetical protein